MSEAMDKSFDKRFGQKPENPEDLRRGDQRVASLKQDARQPRLTMERWTRPQTSRLASARRAPLLQFKRSTGIAVRQKGSKPARPPQPITASKPNLPLPLAGMASWSRTALRHETRVSHPWKCAQQQPPVAYSPPAKPLQRREPPSTSRLFGSPDRRDRIEDFNSIHLVLRQFLPACCFLLPEGH